MSIFFEKRLPTPASAGSRIFTDLKWHRTQPLLALSCYDDRKGGLVAIYDHVVRTIAANVVNVLYIEHYIF
jgi:hypothetical protein